MLRSPRRSVLYVPASNERAIAKATTLGCDAVILDLEDSVAPETKTLARERARAALESGIFGAKPVIIRVNGFPDDPEGPDLLADDLAMLLPAGPSAVLFPKIRSAADARRAESALDAQGGPDNVRLWLMIETPQAVLDIAAIAATAAEENSRLECLVMGTFDLAKEMRLRLTASRLSVLHALCAVVLAGRAYHLDILDGVFSAITDSAGFESEAMQGKGLGFDGKTLIHPSQIEAANRLFSPSEAELSEANAIISAFEAPENAGKGVLTIDGRMTERLHYQMAKRLVAGA